MPDPTTNAVPDSFGRGNSNGYIADIASLGAIHNSKDTAEQLDRLGHQLCDSHSDVIRAVDQSSFRALEQFGLAGVQAEKLSAATDVLVQKTTGEIVTQVTMTAKDAIIDAAKNSAAAQIQAEKIAAAQTLLSHQLASIAAAKAAECCCEIKQVVVKEGCDTRALISEIERRNADRRESDLKTDLSNCKQTAEISRLIDARLGHHGGHGCRPSFTLPVNVVPCSGGNSND